MGTLLPAPTYILECFNSQTLKTKVEWEGGGGGGREEEIKWLKPTNQTNTNKIKNKPPKNATEHQTR